MSPLLPRADRSDAPYIAGLFDLDGTLIDTTELIFQSYQYAFAQILDLRVSTDELLLGYGQPLPEAFTAILRAVGQSQLIDARPETIDLLIATYRAFNVRHHDALAREFPGVPETIAEIGRRGYALGVVTSKGREIARRGLRLIGLADRFSIAVFQEDTILHKPHPDPLWLALDRLGLRDRPDRVVYVGDSTHDLKAGRAAGVRTVAALWGPFPPASLFTLEPTYALATVAALLDLFPLRR
jgi:pyrophosphatase PpaX